jgi:perosamine synthetase
MMGRIPIAGPWITQKEIDCVTDAVTRAWYDDAQLYHQRFERAFAEYLGVRHALSLPSCTAAIHLALAALGIGPGDEVIVPDVTWIASAAPVTYLGATPVFADIDAQTWCLSVPAFEAAITPRTRAVIAVDLYGNMPDMDGLRAVADRHGIAVVEDAAEAIGSEYRGRKAGSLGRAGVFSFHGAKTLTTGEGGLLATDDTELYARTLVLRDHGRKPGDIMFWNTEVAFKYRMSSMQAALGLAQLERIDELVARKRQLFDWYRRDLADLPGVTLNSEPAGTRNSYWMVTLVLDPSLELPKEQLMARLAPFRIDSRPFFYPLSSLPAYTHAAQAALARKRNQVSYRISPYGINLPSALSLTEQQVEFVCARVRDILAPQHKAVA